MLVLVRDVHTNKEQSLIIIIFLLKAELTPQGNESPSLSQTALWLSLLLETNYHQLVMSSEVAIHRLLLSCFTQVSTMVSHPVVHFILL